MNRSLFKNLLPALVLLSFNSSSPSAGVLPVGQPEYDFIYDRWARSDALAFDYFDYQVGPYNLDARPDPGPFSVLRNIPEERLEMFLFAVEDFRAARYSRATGFESFRGGVAGQPCEKLFFYCSFVLDEELSEDEDYTGKRWRGFAGKIEQAFVRYKSAHLDLTAGRFASFWGPRNSLILAPHQKLDGLAYTFRWGRLAVTYHLARLDGLDPDEDDVVQFMNRYYAAHRFDFHLARNLTVGLFETVVFGGPGRQVDLFYLNPLIFFHGAQLNEGMNDNTTVGLDFSYKPKRGCRLYGQLLVDDIQLDDSQAGDKEPDQIGLIVGGYLADVMKNLDLKLEYNRVNNWTFNQMHVRNRYLRDSKLIGGALGIDYDMVHLSVIRWLNSNLNASLGLSYCRQGEGRVDDPWSEPWVIIEGDYSEPFPTGVVQKTATVSLGLKGFTTDFGFVDLQAGIDWVRDQNHAEGASLTIPFLSLNVSTFLFTSLGIEK